MYKASFKARQPWYLKGKCPKAKHVSGKIETVLGLILFQTTMKQNTVMDEGKTTEEISETAREREPGKVN